MILHCVFQHEKSLVEHFIEARYTQLTGIHSNPCALEDETQQCGHRSMNGQNHQELKCFKLK